MNLFNFLLQFNGPKYKRRNYLTRWQMEVYQGKGSISESDVLKNAIRSYGNFEGGKLNLAHF